MNSIEKLAEEYAIQNGSPAPFWATQKDLIDAFLAGTKAKNFLQLDVIKSVCVVCGSDDITEAPHMGRNCNRCNPL